MCSNQVKAGPIPASDEMSKVNFLNLQCKGSQDEDVPHTPMSDSELRERLKAVLYSCHSALHTTKHLTEDYVSSRLIVPNT
jgi:hypothetical protein